jgi:hypothetical protein
MVSHLVRWHEEYAKKGLVIIDIDNGQIDTLDRIKAKVEDQKIKYTEARDPEGKVCGAYGVQAYPVGYLVGVDGNVIWEGHPSGNPKEVEEAIKKELEKVKTR